MSAATRTVRDALAEAAALHHAGRVVEAEAIYRGLLQRHPASPDVRFRLGLLLMQSERLPEASEMFAAALLKAPAFPQLWREQAAVQMRLGHFEAAVVSYARVIELRGADAEAFNNQGAALLRLGRPADALASIDAALAVQPDMPEALCNRGNALLALGRPAEALDSYDRTLALRPNLAQAMLNRAEALEGVERLSDTRAIDGDVIAGAPAVAQTHYNRGSLLQKLARHEDAIASFDAALTLAPDHAAAACNRATSLRALGRLEEAMAGYNQALTLDPAMVQALVNRASLLATLGQHQAALEGYAQARASAPNNVDAHWNELLCRLAMGDFASGWREHEWRWGTPTLRASERHFAQPLWLGETPLAGRTILLHGEQGHGDVLQFCRYAPLVAALGNRGDATGGAQYGAPRGAPQRAEHDAVAGTTVVLEVPHTLARLVRTMPGPQRVIAHSDPTPAFDVHCPLLSLPLAFGTTLETIPAAVPYLRADPDQERAWRIRLATIPGLRVGLVWAGNPRPADPAANAIDHRRSMPLLYMAPLARVPGVSFVSLQKGQRADEAKAPPTGMVLHDWTDELWDFADTAALIAALDLVISVDTSVVHLTGALGKPVWVLNRYDACWRWLYGRTDSPWYPTARLFRQSSPGDWRGVIAEVATALRERIG